MVINGWALNMVIHNVSCKRFVRLCDSDVCMLLWEQNFPFCNNIRVVYEIRIGPRVGYLQEHFEYLSIR